MSSTWGDVAGGRGILNVRVRCTGLSLVLLAVNMLAVTADFSLTLLHTNDVHARFEEFSKYGSDCRAKDKAAGACFGGVARRLSKVQQIREAHDNVLFVDGGDQFQGTLWFHVYGGMATAHFMKRLDYDAMAIGNHEFDRGVKTLISFLRNVTFPVLSANIDATNDRQMAPLYTKSTVVQVGAEQIGLVGFTTTETPLLSDAGDLVFHDEVISVQEEVDRLRALGVNKIVAVGHAGFEMDVRIAERVAGVDIVVGGHTNTFLYNGPSPSNEAVEGAYPHVVTQRGSGKKVLCVQAYTFGKYLGFLQVTFSDDGDVLSWNGNPILLDNTVPQDPATLAEINTWKQTVEGQFSEHLGQTLVHLDGASEHCRLHECNLGNMIADAMVQRYARKKDAKFVASVEIAVVNSGAIRASIPKGNVSLGDAMLVQPFANTIDMIEIMGRYIKGILERAVEDYDPAEKDGKFLQVAGMKVAYDLSRANGDRVVRVSVRCGDCTQGGVVYRPLEHDRVYKVIVPSFLVHGGDGYQLIQDHLILHHIFGDLDVDVTAEYIASNSPISASLENRIVFVEASKSSTTAAAAGLASLSTSSTTTLLLLLHLCHSLARSSPAQPRH